MRNLVLHIPVYMILTVCDHLSHFVLDQHGTFRNLDQVVSIRAAQITHLGF